MTYFGYKMYPEDIIKFIGLNINDVISQYKNEFLKKLIKEKIHNDYYTEITKKKEIESELDNETEININK